MRSQFTVDVEVERESGKFASRDEISSELSDAIECADPGSVEGIGADGDSIYNTVEWSVSEVVG